MTQTVSAPRQGASELIAREIRAELGRQQVSNRRLAERLGVSFMWVNRRISTCDVKITVDEAEEIARALDVPVQQLIAPWLDSAASPNRGVIGASTALSDTLCDANVLTLRQDRQSQGVMRITRIAAAA